MELFVFGETWDFVRSIIEELRLSIMFFFAMEKNVKPMHNFEAYFITRLKIKKYHMSWLPHSRILNLKSRVESKMCKSDSTYIYLDAIESNLDILDSIILDLTLWQFSYFMFKMVGVLIHDSCLPAIWPLLNFWKSCVIILRKVYMSIIMNSRST